MIELREYLPRIVLTSIAVIPGSALAFGVFIAIDGPLEHCGIEFGAYFALVFTILQLAIPLPLPYALGIVYAALTLAVTKGARRKHPILALPTVVAYVLLANAIYLLPAAIHYATDRSATPECRWDL